MDIKERSALSLFATQDSMICELFTAISKLSENKTAIETLCGEMLKVAERRDETFFTKLKPLGYKNIQAAIDAYCEEPDNCNNKED